MQALHFIFIYLFIFIFCINPKWHHLMVSPVTYPFISALEQCKKIKYSVIIVDQFCVKNVRPIT